MREEFDMRRNYMFDRVSKISNVTAVKPEGAFYVLVNISQLGLTSQNFADRLLSKPTSQLFPEPPLANIRISGLATPQGTTSSKRDWIASKTFAGRCEPSSQVAQTTRDLAIVAF